MGNRLGFPKKIDLTKFGPLLVEEFGQSGVTGNNGLRDFASRFESLQIDNVILIKSSCVNLQPLNLRKDVCCREIK